MLVIIECPVRDFNYEKGGKFYSIKARKGWRMIQFTQGTEGKFIRVFKWYIKIGDIK